MILAVPSLLSTINNNQFSDTAKPPKFAAMVSPISAEGGWGWQNSFVWIQSPITIDSSDSPSDQLWLPAQVSELSSINDKEEIWKVTVTLDSVDGMKDNETPHVICVETKGSYHQSTGELELESIHRRLGSHDSYFHYHDLAQLPYVNEPELLSTLQRHYALNRPFLFIGPILLSMNPFTRVGGSGDNDDDDDYDDLYSDHRLQQYIRYGELRKLTHLPPHLYKIAHTAYRHMFIDLFDHDKRENQTIVITGDSGAGKTECSKSIIHYYCLLSRDTQSWIRSTSISAPSTPTLAHGSKKGARPMSVRYENTIEELILLTDAITESFGNAQTLHNNNSSRFGKYIELYYSSEGKIEGVSIRTYLLESTRVTHHTTHDRNFHIFYQLYAGLSSADKKRFGFDSLESFYYLSPQSTIHKSTMTSAPTQGQSTKEQHTAEAAQNDLEKYHQLMHSFNQFNISPEAQQEVFKVIIGILHTGNLSFMMPTPTDDDNTSGCDISPTAECQFHLSKTCEFMGYTQEALREILCYQTITVQRVKVRTGLSIPFAVAMRDRLAMTLYYSLFKWIMAEINLALSEKTSTTALSWIGILDIFGFENIEKNSLEQLCESLF
jgi:myosin V